MERAIFDQSEKMKQTRRPGCEALPFEALPVGKSFTVSFDEMQENSLRVAVSKASKALGRNFRCVKHGKHKLYEIGRLPDDLAQEREIKDFSEVES